MPVIFRLIFLALFIFLITLPFLVQRFDAMAGHTSELVSGVFIGIAALALGMLIEYKSRK